MKNMDRLQRMRNGIPSSANGLTVEELHASLPELHPKDVKQMTDTGELFRIYLLNEK